MSRLNYALIEQLRELSDLVCRIGRRYVKCMLNVRTSTIDVYYGFGWECDTGVYECKTLEEAIVIVKSFLGD